MEETVDWLSLDLDVFEKIVCILPGPSVACMEAVCKPWSKAITTNPAIWMRLLQGVAPEEAAALVAVG